MPTESEIISVIKTVLQHSNKPADNVELSSFLYDGGLGIDSLSAAELSAALEKKFGKDPYTRGQLPQTVAELVQFYAAAK